jgi:hypothetical protein
MKLFRYFRDFLDSFNVRTTIFQWICDMWVGTCIALWYHIGFSAQAHRQLEVLIKLSLVVKTWCPNPKVLAILTSISLVVNLTQPVCCSLIAPNPIENYLLGGFLFFSHKAYWNLTLRVNVLIFDIRKKKTFGRCFYCILSNLKGS